MTEIPQQPERNYPARLYLQGILQVTTARDALRRTGINQNVEHWLSAMLDLHEQKSGTNPKALLEIKVSGDVGNVGKMRTDIITSLQRVAADETIPGEDRQPYAILHEIMTADETKAQ